MSSVVVQSGQEISISAINWVANSNQQTFLYSVQDKNWFGVDNNTTVTDVGKKLPGKYIFKIIKCSGSGDIFYGDIINLESSNKFIQCGVGTCNSGNNASCNDRDWQKFTIKSDSGKSGQVKIGDTVQIVSYADNCAILPADNSLIWCGSSNNNEMLKILLPNGTIGESAKESQDKYNKNRDELLKKQDPTQYNTNEFFDGLFNPRLIITICVLMLVLSMVSSAVYFFKFKK